MTSKQANKVWSDVLSQIEGAGRGDYQNELVTITSEEVNRVSKAMGGPDFRNLSKFDKFEDLPDVFMEKRINILPISRRNYVIGPVQEYSDLKGDSPYKKASYRIPNLLTLQGETANWNENSWISAGLATHALEQAFEDEDLVRTLTGRMGGGNWQFNIQSTDKSKKFAIQLQNPQIEIDSVLETQKAIYILEAKRVKESNFLIRQLYFPYRKILEDLTINKKPIIPIFYEINSETQYVKVRMYEFTDSNVYNSIREFKRFEFQLLDNLDVTTLSEMIAYARSVKTKPSQSKLFPQANDVEKIMTMLEILKEHPSDKLEITQKFLFDPRQADYYANILVYFGLAEKDAGKFLLTKLGVELSQKKVNERNVAFAQIILLDRIFNDLFLNSVQGTLDKNDVVMAMTNENLQLKDSTKYRRASSVLNLINWIHLQVIE